MKYLIMFMTRGSEKMYPELAAARGAHFPLSIVYLSSIFSLDIGKRI